MRVVLYIVYLFTFLLGGTQHGHTEQSASHARLDMPKQFAQVLDNQHISKPHHGVFLDDAEDVLEEENISSSEVRDNGAGKLQFTKHFLPSRKYSHPVVCTGTDFRLKCAKAVTPVYGTSSPIYISQRVLRI